MPLGPKTLTFVVGPKSVAPFFQNRDDVFSQPEVYGFMTQVFGKGVVYDATPQNRKSQNIHMSRGARRCGLGARRGVSSQCRAKSGAAQACARTA